METTEKPKHVIFLYCFLLSYLMAFIIHQFRFYSILINEPGLMETGTALNTYATEFMSKYGNNLKTFKHGTLHGAMISVFLILPVFVTNALFEKKKF